MMAGFAGENVPARPTNCQVYFSAFRPIQDMVIHPESVQQSAQMFEQFLSSGNSGVEQSLARDSDSSSVIADNDVRKFSCNVCQRSFKTPYHLRRHANTHEGIYRHLCPICFKAFRDKAGLKRHYVQHTGDHPCKCSICGRGFAETAKLNKHLQTHTGEYRYRCDICGKGFTENYYLRNHMHSHSGIQWFTCDSCDKKYTCPKSLQRHVAADHDGTVRNGEEVKAKEIVFRCNACLQTFTTRDSYALHMRGHAVQTPPPASPRGKSRKTVRKNLSCLNCNFSFPDEDSFRLHAKSHESPGFTGKLPAVKSKVKKDWKHGPGGPCLVCNKMFSRRDHLKRHLMRIHNMEDSGSPGRMPASDGSGSAESSLSSDSS